MDLKNTVAVVTGGNGGLGHKGIRRRLRLEPHDRDAGALVDGADRIDQPGRHRDVERACGELLHQICARLHVNNVDLEILRREEPLVEADEHRPDVR